MNMGVDRFYVRKTNTYNSICNSNNFCREEFCPSANLKDLTEPQVISAQKPWNFTSLPAVSLKAESLRENPEHLQKLCNKLQELESLGLWHEPIEIEGILASFFNNIKSLLHDKVQEASTPSPDGIFGEELTSMLSNAISSIFGLSVLSGNFEHIIVALQILHDFETAASKELSDAVFEKCSV